MRGMSQLNSSGLRSIQVLFRRLANSKKKITCLGVDIAAILIFFSAQ